MPSIKDHNRFWAIVEEATDSLPLIKDILGVQHYSTITRGDRTLEACRPAGEGFYSIVQQQNTTHLAYILEVPNGMNFPIQEF